MDLDKALELLHNCPTISFGYDCNPRPTYSIEQKDLPILFKYIYIQAIKDALNYACYEWSLDRIKTCDDFDRLVKELIK